MEAHTDPAVFVWSLDEIDVCQSGWPPWPVGARLEESMEFIGDDRGWRESLAV